MSFYLGDFVQSQKNGHVGRIVQKDAHYVGDSDWLAQQNIPPHPTRLKEPWYHIIESTGGGVYCNESDLASISRPKDFAHQMEHFYFKLEQ